MKDDKKEKGSNKDLFNETTLINFKLKNRVFFCAISYDLKKIEVVAQNDFALIVTNGALVADIPTSTEKKI